jgi:hypothetical protein
MEEDKTEIKEEVEEVKEEKEESLIEETKKLVERIERANEEARKLAEKNEKILIEMKLGGKSYAGSTTKEEPTLKDLAKEYFSGSEIEKAIEKYG